MSIRAMAPNFRPFEILQASSVAHIEAARSLFNQYAASLSFSLCFQSFDQELSSLPGDYAPPDGRLLLVFVSGAPVGCGAFHRLTGGEGDRDICEMKRLYVQPDQRGSGIGLALAERLIREAREIGYRAMRLDTVPSAMAQAVKMYRNLGFREIPPYRRNPVPGAIYMELVL